MGRSPAHDPALARNAKKEVQCLRVTSNEGSRRKKERLARGMTRLRYNRLQSAIWAMDSRYTVKEEWMGISHSSMILVSC